MRKTVFLTLLILPLLTCRNPAALLDKLEDDVKSANGLYLEIVDVSPSENGLYINPGEDIRIEFDRAIDLSSVEDAFSVIDSDEILFGSDSNLKSLSYRFDENTNILTIKADPYLDGLKQYTVSILDKIRGADGSSLREAKEWSFSTSDAPRGYVEFSQNYYNENDKDTDNVVLNIYSQGATYCSISDSSDSFEWGTVDIQLTGNPTTYTVDFSNANVFSSALAEGTISLYVVFRDGFSGQAGIANFSAVESDSMIYDTTAPVVTLAADLYGNIANPSPSVSYQSLVENGSGVASYAWSSDSDLTFGSAGSASTTVLADNDGDYTDGITLTVTDRAGNSSSESMTFIRDTVAPTVADAGALNASGDDLGTNREPSFSPDTSLDDVSRYQFRLGNQILSRLSVITSWANWQDFDANKPVMDYGYTHIQFRSVDAAGNPCSSDYYDQYNYYVYPSSGTSPADGGYISGDIAWPRSKTATYYKAYLGTSTLRMDEIVISSGKITIPRYNPFVDAAELSLLVYTTYYWYWEAYDGTGRLVRSPSKGAYSFRTSKF